MLEWNMHRYGFGYYPHWHCCWDFARIRWIEFPKAKSLHQPDQSLYRRTAMHSTFCRTLTELAGQSHLIIPRPVSARCCWLAWQGLARSKLSPMIGSNIWTAILVSIVWPFVWWYQTPSQTTSYTISNSQCYFVVIDITSPLLQDRKDSITHVYPAKYAVKGDCLIWFKIYSIGCQQLLQCCHLFDCSARKSFPPFFLRILPETVHYPNQVNREPQCLFVSVSVSFRTI